MTSFNVHRSRLDRPDGETLKAIEALALQVFSQQKNQWDARLAGRQAILWCWATDVHTGELLGFKVGYEDRPRRFYSWLGGVSPAREGEGIGRALIQAQHEWAAREGYRVVRTHTSNGYRRMLLLNIRQGFDVIGTVHPRPGGEMRIVLEKELATSGKRQLA